MKRSRRAMQRSRRMRFAAIVGVFALVAGYAAAVAAPAIPAQPPAATKGQKKSSGPPAQMSVAQLAQTAKTSVLYWFDWPPNWNFSGAKPMAVFLVPVAGSVPHTLRHWPPVRFQPVAVLTDPGAQIGTGTGTLWNQMQNQIYRLAAKTPGTLPTAAEGAALPASVAAVEAVPPGRLFAVAWPSAGAPQRTIFLEAKGFSMPSAITRWPMPGMRVVAVYAATVFQTSRTLQLDARLLSVESGVHIAKSALRR